MQVKVKREWTKTVLHRAKGSRDLAKVEFPINFIVKFELFITQRSLPSEQTEVLNSIENFQIWKCLKHEKDNFQAGCLKKSQQNVI